MKMARSIAQIQAGIIAAKEADANLAGLTSTSLTADWLLWTWVVAFCFWTVEVLFDTLRGDINGIIALQKPHTLQWYGTKAKAFQYGVALPADTDVYNLVPPVDLAVLIVANAAAIELSNQVRIKVAKGTPGALVALSGGELAAFTTYMGRIKDAGVRLLCTSGAPDTFWPTMVIYYDPLVLDATGARIDGTAGTPVKDAVNLFLAGLPFNGVFILNKYIAAMQAVPGVIIADEVSVQAFYGATPPVVVAAWYVPDAGYMAVDDAFFTANVSYIAYT
jgi:hypothetical protein